MRYVTVERAQSGMVLAAAVTDRRGRLLIPAEATLSDRHIQALQMWGIERIEVVGEEPAEPALPPLPPEEVARIEADVDARFTDEHRAQPFMRALRDCAVARALRSPRDIGAAR
jgi:hypothetical protein